jgi:hypothetical protein
MDTIELATSFLVLAGTKKLAAAVQTALNLWRN